nr:iron-containing alcohol dehydrogenase [Escherichia coli]
MGDALSTCLRREPSGVRKATMAGGASTLAIARLCYTTLLKMAYKAKVGLNKVLAPSGREYYRKLIPILAALDLKEGLAAAHAIHNGMTQLENAIIATTVKSSIWRPGTARTGKRTTGEIETVLNFCHSVGLPTNLHMLGVKEINKDKLRAVAEAATAEGKTIHYMPFVVTAQDVLCAILTAHHLGL